MEWITFLGAALFGALALRLWNRVRPSPAGPARPAIDVAIAAAVFGASWAYLAAIHHRLNPHLVPYGQDNRDYLQCLGALRYAQHETWVPFRYPVYPGASVLYAVVSGTPLVAAALQVSVVSSALIPPSVYALGRTASARPVSLAAALVSVPLLVDANTLGTPTPYPWAAAGYALAVASLVFAVRDGGTVRYLAAGLATATYMGVTAKAVPLLLVGVPAVLAVVATEGKRGVSGAAAFMGPLVACWLGFAWLDLPLHSLEALMFDVHKLGDLVDPAKPFPDVGWRPEDRIDTQGYWVIGRLSSFTHLPQVLLYMLAPPLKAISMQARYDRFVPFVGANLGVPDYPWLVLLTFLGGFGAWTGPSKRRNFVATGLAVGVPAVHLWGLASAQYTDRFALPVLVTAPALLFALAAAPSRGLPRSDRREALAWLPLLLAVGYALRSSPGVLGQAAIEERVEGWVKKWPEPLLAVEPMRDALQPGDVVLDVSFAHLAPVLFDRTGITVQRGSVTTRTRSDGEYFWLLAGGTPAPHRWILLDCAAIHDLGPADQMRDVNAWFARHDDRFEPVGRCLYLDTLPLAPIDTEPKVAHTGPVIPWSGAPDLR